MVKRKRTSKKMPSWKEVRIGLKNQTKIRLITILGRVYLSRSTPKTVKNLIVKTATAGIRKVTKKRVKRKIKTRR